jgi:hypothetical protein
LRLYRENTICRRMRVNTFQDACPCYLLRNNQIINTIPNTIKIITR